MRLRTRLDALNGWQRVWLLATALWLIAVVLITAQDFPTAERLHVVAEEGVRTVFPSVNARGECGKFVSSEKWAQAMVCFQQAEALARQREELVSDMLKRTDERIERELIAQQTMAASKAFALWVVPCILIYVFGLAAGWARRGFHQEK